jgi:hypothetical protein
MRCLWICFFATWWWPGGGGDAVNWDWRCKKRMRSKVIARTKNWKCIGCGKMLASRMNDPNKLHIPERYALNVCG